MGVAYSLSLHMQFDVAVETDIAELDKALHWLRVTLEAGHQGLRALAISYEVNISQIRQVQSVREIRGQNVESEVVKTTNIANDVCRCFWQIIPIRTKL